MFLPDFIAEIENWFSKLPRIAKRIFILSFFLTPLMGYFHYNYSQPDESSNIMEYLIGMVYRLGFILLVFFIADFFRCYLGMYEVEVESQKD